VDTQGYRIPRKRDLEKQMWTTGFRYSWRKMEAEAQYRTGQLDGDK